ncbi:MAG TPA: rhodanese-like domain-containing protein [Mucilaginibacter sp.]|nr:rhodanese-like domain-containing protein [Mucilaginibacter sp.]
MVIIEQIYTGCLAQGAYYIQSDNEAAIIDPMREVAQYIAKANKAGAKIKYIFETHFHADFVSGHIDLHRQTGAPIVYGPGAEPGFKAYIAKDGEEFKLGKATLRVLHTPGHTTESACYLLLDEDGRQKALFSGDTLFIGDVGRPDLAQKGAELTMDDLAGMLYDSLRNKVMPLDDDIVVYPAHGAGSACGKNMSNETTDTLGNQKKYNYALRENMTRAEFIREVTDGLATPPAYFPMNVRMNKEGYQSINEVLSRGTQALSPEAFEAAANETGAILLDTRTPQAFGPAFIPNSINIGIDGSFAPWVGALIPDAAQPILLITDKGREEEVVTRLARVGYDNAIGYLDGGVAAWKASGRELDSIRSVNSSELAELITKQHTEIIDIRRPDEYRAEHLEGVENMPLDYLNENMASLDKSKTYYVHCASGYRSMVFTSILRARGYRNLVDIKGGFGALKRSGKFNITPYHDILG